ncbi:hypothetical protein BKA70DRAFT_1339637 [Coprinopsis sp. MPI-PUGE-AT-0042]|nr:hypothetical protein BKA70DRAFT_1339637 [Coprinopsis sp. MPI-PUGE-AT-0042]
METPRHFCDLTSYCGQLRVFPLLLFSLSALAFAPALLMLDQFLASSPVFVNRVISNEYITAGGAQVQPTPLRQGAQATFEPYSRTLPLPHLLLLLCGWWLASQQLQALPSSSHTMHLSTTGRIPRTSRESSSAWLKQLRTSSLLHS